MNNLTSLFLSQSYKDTDCFWWESGSRVQKSDWIKKGFSAVRNTFRSDPGWGKCPGRIRRSYLVRAEIHSEKRNRMQESAGGITGRGWSFWWTEDPGDPFRRGQQACACLFCAGQAVQSCTAQTAKWQIVYSVWWVSYRYVFRSLQDPWRYAFTFRGCAAAV